MLDSNKSLDNSKYNWQLVVTIVILTEMYQENL